MSDAELGAALGAAEIRRRPWPYASSSPMEELCIEDRRLLLKDLSTSGDLPRPAFVCDPRREIEVYRDVLAAREIDAPVCHAVGEERPWLVLELVDGIPLWQSGDLAVWEDAARWLARLHAAPPPTVARLLRYDAEHLRRRLALAGDIPGAERVALRLASLPPRLIHGEFYPSNVLVQDGTRIRPVDWETAGVGPGVLDLAALTSGWAAPERARIEAAYRDACPPALRPAPADIDMARLVLAAQWIGWSASWRPPPEHARDWRAEAGELIARLGL